MKRVVFAERTAWLVKVHNPYPVVYLVSEAILLLAMFLERQMIYDLQSRLHTRSPLNQPTNRP